MAIVETQYGKVQGNEHDGLQAFKGIPFAAAPIGAQRWCAPQAPQAWSGVRATTQYGNVAWQMRLPAAGPLSFAFDAGAPDRSEDCLALNVWTPAVDGGKRPVMVWIHGGGFTGGSGSSLMYDGRHLVTRGDVVVVSVNYRLGALGFLNLNELSGGRIPATGNEGLLDQIAALRWVRENIAAFGGDPGNVTIFGESAGGMSVGALLGMPAADGLFHKAIPQSGAASTAYTLERSVEVAERFLKRLGLSANDDVDKLLAIEPGKLVTEGALHAAAMGGMVFQPCIDGAVMPQLPIDRVRAGGADEVAVLVGACRDEWRLFTAMDPGSAKLDDAGMMKQLRARAPGVDLGHVVEGYRELRDARGEAIAPVDVFAAVETDRVFRMPGIRLAEAYAARGRDAYQYSFSVQSSAMDGYLESCHAIDIGYVWGTYAMSEAAHEFFGKRPGTAALSATVQDAWLSFARGGHPKTAALADWVPYSPASRSTAVFDTPAHVLHAPRDEERALWNEFEDGLTVGYL